MNDTDPAEVAQQDQEQAGYEHEAKLTAVFFKGLTDEGMNGEWAFILTRDRLGYMHDRWPSEAEDE